MSPFLLVFRQVKEWLILEFHKVIRVLHATACPFVFILFNDWIVKSYEKNDYFLVFLAAWVIFSVFGQVKE